MTALGSAHTAGSRKGRRTRFALALELNDSTLEIQLGNVDTATGMHREDWTLEPGWTVESVLLHIKRLRHPLTAELKKHVVALARHRNKLAKERAAL